ncbi:hypothetical protein N867_01325 [Actinotalea fermentans ATCC 43279 = JCM 9966 = DSM 3133]|nr:hypothetical protein N867_01325 [Actinotalea fermentans ATCC 43279 = JCM 9966 = DSM 3133]
MRLARREEARVLAHACAIAGAVTALTVLAPFSPTAPRALGAALTLVALGLWAALILGADRVRAWQLHAVLATATVLVTVALGASTTPFGALVGAVAYVWIAIFSGVYHRTTVLLRYLGGVTVGLAVGFWHAGTPSWPQAWAFLAATFVAVALVLNRRVSALRREAMTDPLTGAFTRRAFERAAELDMARASRIGMPLTLAVIDLDDFKLVNDAHGHARGDEVLVGLTQAWQATLPRDVLLGRRGGDEFVLLFPGRTLAEAENEVRALSDDLCGWSTGLAQWDGGRDLADLFAAADADLYASKRGETAAGRASSSAGGMGSEPAAL